jgi:hypothetical protein
VVAHPFEQRDAGARRRSRHEAPFTRELKTAAGCTDYGPPAGKAKVKTAASRKAAIQSRHPRALTAAV